MRMFGSVFEPFEQEGGATMSAAGGAEMFLPGDEAAPRMIAPAAHRPAAASGRTRTRGPSPAVPSAPGSPRPRAAMPPVDLDAYRRRARALLDRAVAEAGGGTPSSRALALLRVELERLLEDLVSIGASEAPIEALRRAHDELRAHLERPGRSDADAWRDVARALEAFAGARPASPGAPPTRREFWK
jgi:hypothetical protein